MSNENKTVTYYPDSVVEQLRAQLAEAQKERDHIDNLYQEEVRARVARADELSVLRAKLERAVEALQFIGGNMEDVSDLTYPYFAREILSKLKGEIVPDTSTSIERDECGVETQDSWARRRSHHCKGGTRGIYCFDFHPSHEREKCDEARQRALAEKAREPLKEGHAANCSFQVHLNGVEVWGCVPECPTRKAQTGTEGAE